MFKGSCDFIPTTRVHTCSYVVSCRFETNLIVKYSQSSVSIRGGKVKVVISVKVWAAPEPIIDYGQPSDAPYLMYVAVSDG
jgi:hypothetical protein